MYVCMHLCVRVFMRYDDRAPDESAFAQHACTTQCLYGLSLCLHTAMLLQCLDLMLWFASISPCLHAIFQGFHSVDTGTTPILSPALDVAALCLSSWEAASTAQMLTSVSVTVNQIQNKVHLNRALWPFDPSTSVCMA